MMSGTRWLVPSAALLAVGVIVIALAGPVLASHVTAGVDVGDTVGVGGETAVSVTLQSQDGFPVRNTAVTFYEHGSFAGVEGNVAIGHAMTDDSGVASFIYHPRNAGPRELMMEYAVGDGEASELATIQVDVAGSGQLVHSPAGVDVPGVGVELILVLMSVVWLILLWVVLRLMAIARATTVSSETAT